MNHHTSIDHESLELIFMRLWDDHVARVRRATARPLDGEEHVASENLDQRTVYERVWNRFREQLALLRPVKTVSI